MKVNARSDIIINWIKDYCSSAHVKPKALIVGISGGVELGSSKYTLCKNRFKNYCFINAN